MELLGVGARDSVIGYAARRVGRAMLTAAGLFVVAGLVATLAAGCTGEPCGSEGGALLTWLSHAVRLDFGRTVDNGAVTEAIATALPATALLLALTWFIGLLCGWGGGLLLARYEPRGVSARLLSALAGVCQGVPTFWLGGLLVALFSVGLGLLPPGGIAAPDLPAFGSDAYLDLLRAQPGVVLGDLFGHLILPALTLALAGLATDLRLVATALPAELAAPHVRVARGFGLSRRRLLWRAGRPALPSVIGGSAAGAPLVASALVLVEYLFGWPGVGLLAYHAARAGDIATLAALLLLFGLVVIVIGLVADLLAAWADPRLRGKDST